MSGVAQPPGWYPAQGDPPGTVRWWDGEKWVGGPQTQGAQQQAGYVAPGAGLLANGRELADPWLRIAAGFIDGILVAIVSAIFGASTIIASFNGEASDSFALGDLATTGWPYLGLVVVVLYHTIMNTFLGGGVGKQLLGLRIVNADGSEPLGTTVGPKRSGNHLLDLLAIIPGLGLFIQFIVQGLLNLVSLVFLFSDPEHRTVMDRVANTYVVKKQQS